MRDIGNDAFLAAADRFYQRSNPEVCIHCEDAPVRDESEAVYARYTFRGYEHEGDICLECASRIFEEELEEFAEELSRFASIFTQSNPLNIAAE